MKVKSFNKLSYDNKLSVEKNISDIIEKVNTSMMQVNDNLKAINFTDNFKGYLRVGAVITNMEEFSVAHNIGETPTYFSFYGENRVERFEVVSKTNSRAVIKPYYKSTFLTAVGTATNSIYVANPYLFILNDIINIGNVATHQGRKVTAIDLVTRKITVDGSIAATALQFDTVSLASDKVNIFIA